MKYTFYFFLGVILLFFGACKKHDFDNGPQSISGQVTITGGAPAPFVSVDIYALNNSQTGALGSKRLGGTTTDKNGNYTIAYTAQGGYSYSLEAYSSTDLYATGTGLQDFSGGNPPKLTLQPSAYVRLHLFNSHPGKIVDTLGIDGLWSYHESDLLIYKIKRDTIISKWNGHPIYTYGNQKWEIVWGTNDRSHGSPLLFSKSYYFPAFDTTDVTINY